jgi:hypothetical protein
MLRPARRLAVRVAKMPGLPRHDQSADELAIHVLRPPAPLTSSTPHPTRSHLRLPQLTLPTPGRVRVQHPILPGPRPPLTEEAAEPRVIRVRLVLAPARIAQPHPERDAAEHRRPTRPAPSAVPLIAVTRPEQLGTAPARTQLSHQAEPGRKSGGNFFRARVRTRYVSKKEASASNRGPGSWVLGGLTRCELCKQPNKLE